jgi:hypothetical protein
VYNSETNTVEDSIHIKFDNKEPDNKMSKLVEKFGEIQITEDASTPEHAFEASKRVSASDGPKVGVPYETHSDEVDSEEVRDGSKEATQFKTTFKYKFSHPKELIIGNKDSPLKIR